VVVRSEGGGLGVVSVIVADKGAGGGWSWSSEVRERRGKMVSIIVGGEGARSGVVVVVGGGRGGQAVVVIGGCGCGDVREWGVGLGWCRRHIIIVG
jgi:hypothetical protein